MHWQKGRRGRKILCGGAAQRCCCGTAQDSATCPSNQSRVLGPSRELRAVASRLLSCGGATPQKPSAQFDQAGAATEPIQQDLQSRSFDVD